MKALLDGFKAKITDGQSVIGPFMKTGDPAFVEAAGYAGFDFVILDREHGPVSIETMQNNVRAAMVAGALPIIRVPDSSESSIGKALDIGALGIQVPQVTNAKQAEQLMQLGQDEVNKRWNIYRQMEQMTFTVPGAQGENGNGSGGNGSNGSSDSES